MISESEKTLLQIGYKQTIRALNESKVTKAFLAEDCDTKISVPVKTLCNEKNVPVFFISSMSELGKLCEIDVGASCAVVLSK